MINAVPQPSAGMPMPPSAPMPATTPVTPPPTPIESQPTTPETTSSLPPFEPPAAAPMSQKPPKKGMPLKGVIGLLVLILTVVGGAAGFYLTQMNQDVRQQASETTVTQCGERNQASCNNGCEWKEIDVTCNGYKSSTSCTKPGCTWSAGVGSCSGSYQGQKTVTIKECKGPSGTDCPVTDDEATCRSYGGGCGISTRTEVQNVSISCSTVDISGCEAGGYSGCSYIPGEGQCTGSYKSGKCEGTPNAPAPPAEPAPPQPPSEPAPPAGGTTGPRTPQQVCSEKGGSLSSSNQADPNCSTQGGVSCDYGGSNHCCYGDAGSDIRDGKCYNSGNTCTGPYTIQKYSCDSSTGFCSTYVSSYTSSTIPSAEACVQLEIIGANGDGCYGIDPAGGNVNCGGDTPDNPGGDDGEIPGIGHFDTISCSQITGWACDPDAINSSVDVHFWIGTTTPERSIGKVVASADPLNATDMSNIAAACGGNAARRFTFTIPEDVKSQTDKKIFAFIIDINKDGSTDDNNPQLTNSPKQIVSCVGPACVSLSMSPAAPKYGEAVNLTCAQVAGATSYSFNVTAGGNVITPIISNNTATFNAIYTGSYQASCSIN